MTNKYLPGLDALRAFAALIVIILHTNQLFPKFSSNFTSQISELGIQSFAVTIFFVLSGFLITLLLLKEKVKNKKIGIANFYMRRLLKIWPLYFFIIAIVFSISIFWPNLFWENTNFTNFYYYVFFIGNIGIVTNHIINPLVPFWSIGVEEQFYIIWPFIVRCKNVLRALIIFLFIFLLFKVGLRICGREYAHWLVESRYSCMAIGGIGAHYYYEKSDILKIIYSPVLQIFAWLLMAYTFFYKPIYLANVFNHELYSLFFLVIILNISTNPKSILVFDNFIFNFLGKISFGLYCWHLPIIYLLINPIRNYNFQNFWYNKLFIYLLVLLLTFFISFLSFRFFERPFLNLKNKFKF